MTGYPIVGAALPDGECLTFYVMPELRQCALCSVSYEPREESHIIPKFVYRWLKASSTTEFMRFGPEMNRHSQDGIKDHFLCETCEDRFAALESTFATEIFHPFVADNFHEADYAEWMLKFAVSVSWRLLAYKIDERSLPHFRGRHTSSVTETLQRWRDYLLDRRDDIGEHEIHLLPLTGIIDHSASGVPKNINRYLRRTVEIEAGVSDTEAFTYYKLGPVIFIGLIAYPDLTHWKGTRISHGGRFPPRDIIAPGQYLDFISMRSRRLEKFESQFSERQLAKIKERYKKKIGRFEQSDTCRTLLMDLDLE